MVLWHINLPDKSIRLEITHNAQMGMYVVLGNIKLFETNEEGIRSALRIRVPLGRNTKREDETPGKSQGASASAGTRKRPREDEDDHPTTPKRKSPNVRRTPRGTRPHWGSPAGLDI